MKCVKIKDMKGGRAKVLVFGDRYWKDTDHKKRIRYVFKFRLTTIPSTA